MKNTTHHALKVAKNMSKDFVRNWGAWQPGAWGGEPPTASDMGKSFSPEKPMLTSLDSPARERSQEEITIRQMPSEKTTPLIANESQRHPSRMEPQIV